MEKHELLEKFTEFGRGDLQQKQNPKRFYMSIPWSIWERLCDVAAKEHRPPGWQIEAFIVQGLEAYEKKEEM